MQKLRKSSYGMEWFGFRTSLNGTPRISSAHFVESLFLKYFLEGALFPLRRYTPMWHTDIFCVRMPYCLVTFYVTHLYFDVSSLTGLSYICFFLHWEIYDVEYCTEVLIITCIRCLFVMSLMNGTPKISVRLSKAANI